MEPTKHLASAKAQTYTGGMVALSKRKYNAMQDETETEDEGGQLVAPRRNRQPMLKPNPSAGIRFQEHV